MSNIYGTTIFDKIYFVFLIKKKNVETEIFTKYLYIKHGGIFKLFLLIF